MSARRRGQGQRRGLGALGKRTKFVIGLTEGPSLGRAVTDISRLDQIPQILQLPKTRALHLAVPGMNEDGPGDGGAAEHWAFAAVPGNIGQRAGPASTRWNSRQPGSNQVSQAWCILCASSLQVAPPVFRGAGPGGAQPCEFGPLRKDLLIEKDLIRSIGRINGSWTLQARPCSSHLGRCAGRVRSFIGSDDVTGKTLPACSVLGARFETLVLLHA
jgi:hypothetical protein